MATINLPNNWRPRPYQRAAWDYLERGGKHCELVWHRRSGKDEISLHRTAVAAFERVANYWHCLPQASQARKAIWDAVDPATGKRRIDQAFPHEIRKTTRNHEMQIELINGSSWQVVGSDNYDSLVGSTPAGVIYSEWALCNPSARAYLRPILAENNGWQIFITTPRGRNHAYQTLKSAEKSESAFSQVLPATQTDVFSRSQLNAELQSYIEEFGSDYGRAKYEQEYLCSFEAANIGSYYGAQMRDAEQQGRICQVDYDKNAPVHTAWDLGYSDDTGIWFYQVIAGEVHILKYYGASGLCMGDYLKYVREQPYRYGYHWLPHDAKARTLASGGKSIEEMARTSLGYGKVRIVPNLSVQDGIQAVRLMLAKSWIDKEKCEDGIEALINYQRVWDDTKKCFSERPLHDWSSHAADAARMMAIAWREEHKEQPKPKPKFWHEQTLDELYRETKKSNRI